MTAEAIRCPHCYEPATGRFCSACGKPLDADASATLVVKDALGIKPPPWRAIGRTVAMACARPAELSRRWADGERQGLISPFVAMSTVAAVTAAIGFLLTAFTGHRAPADGDTHADMVAAAPFLAHAFPARHAIAAHDPAAFLAAFKRLGSWLAVLWPALFVAPGALAFAPWSRLSRHRALIVAIVETLFLLVVAGGYASLAIAVPTLAASGAVSTLFAIGIGTHTALHVRHAIGYGWGYAATRPMLATLYFTILVYLWVIALMALTLIALPALEAGG